MLLHTTMFKTHKKVYLTSVHLSFTFLCVSLVKGCNICEHYSHMLPLVLNITMNLSTTFCEFGGFIFMIDSTFF